MNPLISAHRLTKRFGTFTAIEDVSFEVAGGDIVGFLGPNGAGKSITLRILAGVYPPSRGQATIGGYDVVGDSLRARSLVGYFPERLSLYLDMTVARYLTHVGRLKGLAHREARRDAGQAVGSCGLERVAERLIGSLSKGFRQRVGLAQALVGSPRVLILDEPTAGLDPEQVAEIRALIRSLRHQRTVILSTHILSEVEAMCDHVIIIHRGRILAVNTPSDLNQRLRRTSRTFLQGVGPQAAVVQHLRQQAGVLTVNVEGEAVDGVVPLTVTAAKDRDLREELATTVAQQGWGLRELRPVMLTLEEIFLSLVTQSAAAVSEEVAYETRRDLPA